MVRTKIRDSEFINFFCSRHDCTLNLRLRPITKLRKVKLRKVGFIQLDIV